MRLRTPLKQVKTQGISLGQPAFRHSAADNQRQDKRVESLPARCLDGGSTPPISTDKKMAFQLCCGPFSTQCRNAPAPQPGAHSQPSVAFCDISLPGRMRPSLSAPAGGCAASTSLRKSRRRSATAADAAFGLRPQRIVPPFCTQLFAQFCTPLFWGDSGTRTVCQHFTTASR